jgi:hypothetical protein
MVVSKIKLGGSAFEKLLGNGFWINATCKNNSRMTLNGLKVQTFTSAAINDIATCTQ